MIRFILISFWYILILLASESAAMDNGTRIDRLDLYITIACYTDNY